MHRAVYSPASETGSVSETPDTPPKQETSSVPDTATKAAGSAEEKASAPSEQTEAVVAADKPAADPAAKPAKADSAEKQPKADKPAKTDKPDKPAKPAAKQKPEDKPFATFIQEDFLPTLTKSLTERESAPISLELVEGERPVVGGACWMVQGVLPAERRFWLCFASDAITSGKTIALAESGSDPSLLESFLIDEKRINLALLESRLLQRLNGQKWFGGN